MQNKRGIAGPLKPFSAEFCTLRRCEVSFPFISCVMWSKPTWLLFSVYYFAISKWRQRCERRQRGSGKHTMAPTCVDKKNRLLATTNIKVMILIPYLQSAWSFCLVLLQNLRNVSRIAHRSGWHVLECGDVLFLFCQNRLGRRQPRWSRVVTEDSGYILR